MKSDTVYGIHAVTALLQARPGGISRLYFSQKRTDPRVEAVKQLAEDQGVSCELLAARDFGQRFDQWKHQGVVAHVEPCAPLSEPEMLDMLAGLQQPALVLVLDQITDPHNFGAILRTADAAGVHCVVVPKSGSVGITPVVRKVASGAAETVPVCRVANLARSLAELRSIGLWLYGAAGESGAESYERVDYRAPAALVVGAEGKGLRRLSREACDQLIRIPMAGLVTSLNVSVATGVCLFEVVRQRRGEKTALK